MTQGIASATGGLQLGTGPTIENLFCNGVGQAITSGLGVSYTCAGGGCSIVCPANIVTGTDPGLCSAVEIFAPGGTCANVVCVPPSGSAFPEGVNNVTCDDGGGPGSPCQFTVTVNDTEPPQITCPADIEIDIPPYSTGQNVDYDPPVTSDNCGVDSVDCQPPSGDVFPAGTTPVNCLAYDAAGNSANCSFQVILNSVSVLEIPTISTLGLAALALLLAGAAFLVFRKNG